VCVMIGRWSSVGSPIFPRKAVHIILTAECDRVTVGVTVDEKNAESTAPSLWRWERRGGD
jgi:hypothetical protein